MVDMQRRDDAVHKYYFENPEIWEDVQQKRAIREVAFLAKIFEKYGKVKNFLDVGCATGLHVYLLEKQGYVGTGMDLNRNMITHAKRKYPECNFLVGDQKRIRKKAQYHAVISLNTVFIYNATNEQILSTLKNYLSALKKGGLLVLDVLNPISFIQQKPFKQKVKHVNRKHGYYNIQTNTVDARNQVLFDKRSWYRLSDGKKLYEGTTKLRLLFPQEFRFFVEQAGFRFVELYGDFKLSAKKLDGFRMILVAKK